MRTLIVLFTSFLAGCSKSPMDATLNGANAAATKLMAPLVQKDASRQVEGLIRTIDDRPACRAYIERLRDAGRGSPYEGATEVSVRWRPHGVALWTVLQAMGSILASMSETVLECGAEE
jgi:hypothetical protein